MVIAEMQRRALMAMDLEPKVDRLLRSDWERERVEKMAKQEARRKAKVEARREAKAARAETKLAERRQRGTVSDCGVGAGDRGRDAGRGRGLRRRAGEHRRARRQPFAC